MYGSLSKSATESESLLSSPDTNQVNNAQHNKNNSNIDMSAHIGLRGVVIVYIMIHHCFLLCNYELNLTGDSMMPIFFLLSGFSLTYFYGRKQLQMPRQMQFLRFVLLGRSGDDALVASGDVYPMDIFAFYRKRFARIAPIYYLCLAVSVPLLINGFGTVDPDNQFQLISSVATSVIPVNTWVVYTYSMVLPAWFIPTLFAYYIVFPYIIPYIQRMSDRQLCNGIVRCYWLQMAIIMLMWCAIMIGVTIYDWSESQYWFAFRLTLWHPITRFPVFLMGAYAAMLCFRHPTSNASIENPDIITQSQNTDTVIDGWMRFPSLCCLSSLPRLQWCNNDDNDDDNNTVTQSQWIFGVDRAALTIILLFAIVVISETVVHFVMDMSSTLMLGSAFWFQSALPMIQLYLIVALTRDINRVSMTSRFLNSPICQWLGGISMPLYLIHYPIISYLWWILYDFKSLQWGNVFSFQRLIPMWGIPAVIVASIAIAAVLHYSIEAPLRQKLRPVAR